MHEPRLNHVQCLDTQGLHRMAYWEWGDPANPKVLVCVHGLSRQGRDFDTLAQAMCDEYRVVCPDVVGRGESDRLADPSGYQIPAYAADMVTLLARLNAGTVHWVGTSMGGLIGLVVGALKNSPISRLVLNDVGPVVELDALARIGTYLGAPSRWKSLEEAADALWAISQGFGPHTREQWLALTRPMIKPDGDGFVPHYDLNIAVPFRGLTPEIVKAGEAQIWAMYDSLRCRVLLLRGAESDLLSPATAKSMTERGPRAELREFAGVGHAPMLHAADQVAAVREFLLRP
ncbi:alpha/beta fold hydrolase [Piscinibacter sp. HJYY11]|uniref:alpha/beta fold hydrolase n=1 Tax=Piscinibacter sp. HJYY11 TaxID=2801333 RepID=UPI00191D227A|nr:alpha/beta hydrolase [Piscinibacter sp. HJYY11]MBL0731185.1 alpha/beta hydrolase [Piscinibacter sp. HJYY11]